MERSIERFSVWRQRVEKFTSKLLMKSSAKSSSNTSKFPRLCTSSVLRRTTAFAASLGDIGFRLTLIYLPLFLENTQLTKAAHPILCVPGSNNFPVFVLVNVHNLNVDAAILL